MIENKVKLTTLSKDPSVCITTKSGKKYDVGAIYNNIISLGYNISPKNIDKILDDEVWQYIILYGINLMTFYPYIIHSVFIIFLLEDHKKEFFGKEDVDIFEELNSIKTNEGSIDMLNKIFNQILNEQSNIKKFIYFKIVIDFLGIILYNIITYSVSDKNIEDKIKDKIIH